MWNLRPNYRLPSHYRQVTHRTRTTGPFHPGVALDKVPLRSYVDVVSDIIIVVQRQYRLARKYGIARVGGTLASFSVFARTPLTGPSLYI